jgi:VWFA-related protein
MHFRLGLAFLTAGLAIMAAQQGGAPVTPVSGTTPAPAQNAPETKAVDEPATFHTRVNLVMVPVVVRDKSNQIIGTLKKDDFHLLDRGKPQEIIKFSVEEPARPAGYRSSGSGGEKTGAAEIAAPGEASPAPLPDRFVAYLFDDVHTSFADLARVRDAAIRHLNSLGPKERAAVYTISGQVVQEFTDDRDALKAAIQRLFPHPLTRSPVAQCPDISYYQADMIVNKNDPMALQIAVSELISCANMDTSSSSTVQQATSQVQGLAQTRYGEGEQETRVALYTLMALVKRMGTMPGQRVILLASAGFIAPLQQQELTDILDRALKVNVVIGAVDARGLYTDSQDVSGHNTSSTAMVLKQQYQREAARAQADILEELAAGTGGTFFQNNNDLYAGFERVAAAPDYVYMLGFSPQNLKLDGSFHSLKVTVKGVSMSIQARKGYYAPRHLADPKETAREEISEALFSREEQTDLPVGLTTQYFKSSENNARVTVLMRVDAKKLKFRKEDDRNCNELTIATALFDRNGNFVVGNQKRLDMRLRDETLAKRLDNGLTVRSSFDVKPGAYTVRLVVRDAEGQLMSASNGALDIR